MNSTVETNHSQCYFYSVRQIFEEKPSFYEHYLIVLVTLNAVLAFTAVFSNFVVIATIFKTPSLQTPSNILMCGLSVTDFIVGVVCQPSYCLFKLGELMKNRWLFCHSGLLYTFGTLPLATVSFLTVSAIIADRFLAVTLHLRYQQLVTSARVCITLAVIWTIGITFTIYTIVFHYHISTIIINNILFCVVFALDVFFVVRITLIIRQHTIQIQSQLQATHHDATTANIDLPSIRKSLKMVCVIILAFVVCYVPFGTVRLVPDRSSPSLRILFTLAETLVMTNGILNPFIYFWRIVEMRNASIRILKRLCCRSNQVTPN